MASMAFCVAAATSVAIILACCLHGHADARSVVPSGGTTMPSHRGDHQAAAEDSCMVRWLLLIPAVADAQQVERFFKLFSQPVDEANIATVSPLQLMAGLGSKSSANHFTSCLADKTSACHIHAPCQNGGMCRYSESPAIPTPSYQCVCPDGFTGKFCQEQQPSCSGNPCQNGGTCQGNNTAYRCHCPQHFSGTHCEHEWLNENKFLAIKSAISEFGEEMRISKAQALEERKQDVQHLDSFLQRLERRLVSKLNESLSVIKSNVTSLSKMMDSVKKNLLVYKHTLTGDCSAVTQDTAAQGQTSIDVDSCWQFWNGKRVMVHQTQGSGNAAGTYQIADIHSCQDKILTLQQPLKHTFYSGSFGGVSPNVTQVVPVIQALRVAVCQGRIEAPAWNGRCGGIVAIQAQKNIEICSDSSAISATGKGFRGAPQFRSAHDFVYGYIGESEQMGYSVRRQKAGVGLGGGSGNGNSGGAGGAHQTVGTPGKYGGCSQGGSGASPKGVLITSGADRLYFGGSGGASGSHGPILRGRYGARGGASGGIVYLEAKGNIETRGQNQIQASGLPGQNGYLIPGKGQSMGGGGGGAGGTVAYKQEVGNQITATVNGGNGGSRYVFSGQCGSSGSGGNGGTGEIIRLQ